MAKWFLPPAPVGKRTVFFALAVFALGQLALSAYLESRKLETRDPLYGFRLRGMRARLAESPAAPLFLLLGSSRVKYGLRPEAIPLRPAEGEQAPTVYNFGLNGLGTIRELLYYRRLLAAGVRPRWMLVEIWPPLWPEAGFLRESRMVSGEDDLRWADLPLLWRFFRQDRDLLRAGVRNTLVPVSNYRGRLLASALPPLLAPEQVEQMRKLDRDCATDDRGGWFPWPLAEVTDATRNFGLEDGAEKIKPLVNPLVIDPRSDAALRELLTDCDRRGIRVVLLMMPEHSVMRGWYCPQATALVRDYLRRLRQDHPAPVVDARTWVADVDFADSCHMARTGVPSFCERLGREVMQPFIDGRPLLASVLYDYQDSPGAN